MKPRPGTSARPRSALRILSSAAGLYLAGNLVFGALDPMPVLGKLSVYNTVIPGRQRLPYAEAPDLAYNLSLDRVEPMLASHEVAVAPRSDEYRVLILGDSSVWGFLLSPEQTLAGQLNAQAIRLPDGRDLRAYNLGYPVMSLLKDALLLNSLLANRPNLVVWMVSLEAFPYDKQLSSALIPGQSAQTKELIESYDLPIDLASKVLKQASFWQRTIVGQRRELADQVRLQFYGVMWAATGRDQYYPESYEPTSIDLSEDVRYHETRPPVLPRSMLAFEVLSAGDQMLGGIPLVIINEPIFTSNGLNSHLRYNDLYPRWAYDEYRRLLAEVCDEQGWTYYDFWDAISPAEFTNTAIHLTPAGTRELAARVGHVVRVAASADGAK